MKRIVLYYSRSGHNRQMANELVELISSADIKEIIDKDPKSFIISGWHAIKKKKTEIKPIDNDLKNYDQIILVSPIWVGGIPPTTRTFIEQYLIGSKEIAFLSVSGNGEKNEKICR